MQWPNFDPRIWKRAARDSHTSNPVRDESDETEAPQDTAKATHVMNVTKASLAPHLLLGRRGEALAAAYLKQNNYRLVAANVMLPVGRSLRGQIIQAEIDIVAYEAGTLCFVEVKTRASDWYAAPETNVDLRKQRQISRAARVYRRTFGLLKESHRYDVVSVILPHAIAFDALAPPNPRIKLLRDFWTDEKFRKRRWMGGTYDD